MKLLFTCLLLTVSSLLFAQYQNRVATLTDRGDNTTTGVVRYYDWAKNPRSIEFGKDSLEMMRNVPIRNIRNLTIKDGAVYEGLYLKVPYYLNGPVAFGSSIVGTVDSTYYLAELLLVSEPVRLYRIFDNNEKVRFCVAKYDSLVLLEDIDVQLIRHDQMFNFRDQKYRKQLKAVLHECPTLSTAQTQYTESSLIELLKEYLSFCRIDSKIYLEQKKFSKPVISVGGNATIWPFAGGGIISYGVSVQVQLPRKLNNTFVLVNVGQINSSISDSKLDVGLYGGKYWGRQRIQGRVYTGLSVLFGPLDTGLGISYRKMISLDMRYPVLAAVLSGFRDSISTYVKPVFSLSAVFPISRGTKR